MTEFLGGERSIQLSYEDGYHIIIPQLPQKIQVESERKKVYPIGEVLMRGMGAE